jgi:hypothetical protein
MTNLNPLPIEPGETFGKWTVTETGHRKPNGKNAFYSAALCRCACGTERVIPLTSLRNGDTRSCRKCIPRTPKVKPPKVPKPRAAPRGGISRHELYQTWAGIKARCFNPNTPYYRYYGGRGITIHPAWAADSVAFITWVDSNLGPRPAGHTLDRIDNDGDYRPGNLRWATPEVQLQNRRPKANATGYPGVKKVTKRGRTYFEVRMVIDGKRKTLGQRKTPEEAHALYVAARTA